MGDNGKIDTGTPQSPDSEKKPSQQPQNDNELVEVIKVFVNKTTHQISVNGLLGEKTLCLNALAEALKIVANFQPSPIIQPGRKPAHNIMNFMRGRLKG